MYKKLFALTITSTLSISSLIGTGIVLLNQNNNKNLVTHYNNNKSSKKSQSIEEAKKQGIKIRTNPINGFDSLDVRDGSGNKLVLTTVQKPNELKTYGVALVNFESNEMLSHWEIPVEQEFVKNYELESDKKYVTNYTTNIIPGNNANEFFVLAGISNLADALNTVYTEYNEDKTAFEDIVGADKVKENLEKAPSIKIFKLKINNNTLELNEQEQDNNKGYYDFKYDVKDDKTYESISNFKGSLKFFTTSGISSSLFAQQNYVKWCNSMTSTSLGYLQYLQYGQLFQVNYGNKNEDEFVLLNSWLSNDVSMGNLYAFYSTKINSLAPALSIIDYFYDDALKPMIANPDSGNNESYKLKNDASALYQIKTESNKIEPAPKSDQLNKKTAIALAFMYDYAYNYRTNVHDASEVVQMKKTGHPFYGFVPGWFLFKPKLEKINYGYIAFNANIDGTSIWCTNIGTYYDTKKSKYYIVIAYSKWIRYQVPAPGANGGCSDFDHGQNYGDVDKPEKRLIRDILLLEVDFFPSSSTSSDVYHQKYTTLPSHSKLDYTRVRNDNNHQNGSMFIKVINENKNEIAVVLNATNKIAIFKENSDPFYTINEPEYKNIDNKSIELTVQERWLNIQYDEGTNTLTAISENIICSFILNDEYDDNDVKAHKHSSSISTIDYVFKKVISSEGLYLNSNSNSNENINELTKISNIIINGSINSTYSIQTLTNNNTITLLGIITPNEVGYSITKPEDSQDIKKLSIGEIISMPPEKLLETFSESRKNGTSSYPQIGLIIANRMNNYLEISEILTINNKLMLGFSLISGTDVSPFISGISRYKYDTFTGEYEDPYVVFNDKKTVEQKNKYKKFSVAEIIEEFDQNDTMKKDLYNIVIKKADPGINTGVNESDFSLKIDINNTDSKNNSIAFYAIVTTNQGQSRVKIQNSIDRFFKYEGIFATKLSSQTIMWIIIGTTLGIAALLALGLGIGIPMRKNAKMTKEGFALSHQKMDTLTAAIGNVFKKMSDVNVKKKTPMLLRDKKQTPSTLKPRSPINSNRPIPSTSKPQSPINSNRPIPKKPINSVQPKRPIDTSQKSN